MHAGGVFVVVGAAVALLGCGAVASSPPADASATPVGRSLTPILLPATACEPTLHEMARAPAVSEGYVLRAEARSVIAGLDVGFDITAPKSALAAIRTPVTLTLTLATGTTFTVEATQSSPTSWWWRGAIAAVGPLRAIASVGEGSQGHATNEETVQITERRVRSADASMGTIGGMNAVPYLRGAMLLDDATSAGGARLVWFLRADLPPVGRQTVFASAEVSGSATGLLVPSAGRDYAQWTAAWVEGTRIRAAGFTLLPLGSVDRDAPVCIDWASLRPGGALPVSVSLLLARETEARGLDLVAHVEGPEPEILGLRIDYDAAMANTSVVLRFRIPIPADTERAAAALETPLPSWTLATLPAFPVSMPAPRIRVGIARRIDGGLRLLAYDITDLDGRPSVSMAWGTEVPDEELLPGAALGFAQGALVVATRPTGSEGARLLTIRRDEQSPTPSVSTTNVLDDQVVGRADLRSSDGAAPLVAFTVADRVVDAAGQTLGVVGGLPPRFVQRSRMLFDPGKWPIFGF